MTIQSMTVAELIEQLQQQDPDAQVVMTANYGDRSRTLQALSIRRVEESQLTESGYSETGWAIGEDAEDYRPVVALFSTEW